MCLQLMKCVLSLISRAESVHLIFLRHISFHKIFRQGLSDLRSAPDNNKVSCAVEGG